MPIALAIMPLVRKNASTMPRIWLPVSHRPAMLRHAHAQATSTVGANHSTNTSGESRPEMPRTSRPVTDVAASANRAKTTLSTSANRIFSW